MPQQLTGEKLKQRNQLIRRWLKAGITTTEIQKRVKTKYGIGTHSYTIAAIREELGLESPIHRQPSAKYLPKAIQKARAKRKTKTKKAAALTLSSPTGLVSAREVSQRLQALITQVADSMAKEGVLTVTIDRRQVSITHTPEETMIEV